MPAPSAAGSESSRSGRAPIGPRASVARTIAVALVLLWTAASIRRTIRNEPVLGPSTADPYSTATIIGPPTTEDGEARTRTVIALRQLADAAGDRHAPHAPALVILPADDTAAVTFVLFQLAHLWYPQVVEVRADTGRAPHDAAMRAAFVYAHERTRASGEPVARAGPFVALRARR